ncbi:hypothetical protein [Rhizobium sp. Rhizsp82]|uniref:hypothetical protein n=1 Tax=Rhizobium sp. Rhizsp82 TaxID=3243057 RepID=UPI0039B65F38
MAFSGVRIECYRGMTVLRDSWWSYLMPGLLEWSQSFASPAVSGITTKTAVRVTADGDPVFRVHNAEAIYVAIGRNPNAADDSKRLYLSAGGSIVLKAEPGDKLAWVAA